MTKSGWVLISPILFITYYASKIISADTAGAHYLITILWEFFSENSTRDCQLQYQNHDLWWLSCYTESKNDDIVYTWCRVGIYISLDLFYIIIWLCVAIHISHGCLRYLTGQHQADGLKPMPQSFVRTSWCRVKLLRNVTWLSMMIWKCAWRISRYDKSGHTSV